MFFGKLSTGEELIDKLLYMGISVMILFIVIFFLVPFMAHTLSIGY